MSLDMCFGIDVRYPDPIVHPFDIRYRNAAAIIIKIKEDGLASCHTYVATDYP